MYEIPMHPCGRPCRCQEVQFGKLDIYGVPYIGVGNRSQLLRTYRRQRGWTWPVTEQNFKLAAAPSAGYASHIWIPANIYLTLIREALCRQSYLDLISSGCATFVWAVDVKWACYTPEMVLHRWCTLFKSCPRINRNSCSCKHLYLLFYVRYYNL